MDIVVDLPWWEILWHALFREPAERLLHRLRTIPAWGWLVGLAAVLRLVNLGAENLWYDECFTAFLTKLSLPNLWLAIQGDDHPPLWYAIEWPLTHLFGSSEFVLRLPSALFGVLAVYLMWRLALRVTRDDRVAFVAGLILCLLPSALYYSQEARMYALLLVFTLWAVDSLIRANYRQFALAGIGLVYTHNVGVLYVLILGGAALANKGWSYWNRNRNKCSMRPLREVFGPPITALVAIGLAWLPWAIFGLMPQLQKVGANFWMPPLAPGDMVYPWLAMWMGVRAGEALQMTLYLGGLLAIGIGLVGSWRWLSGRAEGRLILAALFGVPLADVIVSVVWRNIYLHRTLLPCVCLMALPVAYALVHLKSTGGQMLRLVFAISLIIGLVAHYAPDGTRGRTSTQAWLSPLYMGWQSGDVIYHLAMDSAIGADYYTVGYLSAVLPEAGDLAQSLTDQTRQAMGLTPRTLEQLHAEGYRRVWLFMNDSPMSSRAELDEWQRIIHAYPNYIVQYNDQQNGLARLYIYLLFLEEP